MNVVKTGSTLRIHGDDVKVMKNLPAGYYQYLPPGMMTPPMLEEAHLPSIKEKHIYGKNTERVEKILRSYSLSNRNFGVILSGEKGTGKSLLLSMLVVEAVNSGIPVINVVDSTGLPDFMSEVTQDVVLVFDEFDKTHFSRSSNQDAGQEALLTMFDGIGNSHILSVIAVNSVSKLNEFFVNRPGRFNYHFEVLAPDPEEIHRYLVDNLENADDEIVERIVAVSVLHSFSFDILRSIVTELNNGYDLGETFRDLNIDSTTEGYYTCIVTLNNGDVYTGSCWVDFDDDYDSIELLPKDYAAAQDWDKSYYSDDDEDLDEETAKTTKALSTKEQERVKRLSAIRKVVLEYDPSKVRFTQSGASLDLRGFYKLYVRTQGAGGYYMDDPAKIKSITFSKVYKSSRSYISYDGLY